MKTATTQVNTKYQVVIPEDVRMALNIKPHDYIIFFVDENEVYLRALPKNFTKSLSGLHTHIWQQPSEDWLRDERTSWKK